MAHCTPYTILLVILLLMPHISTKDERTVFDTFNPFLRTLKLNIGRMTNRFETTKHHQQLLEGKNKAVRIVPASVPFPCNLNGKIRSEKVPTNVHQIRPGDVDVIGALGDSLSAGTGVSSTFVLHEFFFEQRGRSFSIGGEKTWRTFLTLPNILKMFNPNLFGFALKGSQSFEKESQFNVAENGAISGNMPYMVKELVKRIKNDPRVDMKKHWKMITMMIGDNNFCSEVCYYKNYYDSLKEHRKDILFVLRYLRDNLPRTIVNIIPPPRLDLFYELKRIPVECYLVHNVACPCLNGLAYRNRRKIISDIMEKWQQIDLEVSNRAEFDLDDFTVIPHHFTLNYTFPKTPEGKLDFGFLAPDCFHFSEKGHARFANDLWNSLLEPFGKKV